MGTFAEDRLPAEAALSQEADIVLLDGEDGLAGLIDGTIEELSPFHEAFSV